MISFTIKSKSNFINEINQFSVSFDPLDATLYAFLILTAIACVGKPIMKFYIIP